METDGVLEDGLAPDGVLLDRLGPDGVLLDELGPDGVVLARLCVEFGPRVVRSVIVVLGTVILFWIIGFQMGADGVVLAGLLVELEESPGVILVTVLFFG